MAPRESGLIRPYSAALVELGRGLDALIIIASLWAVSELVARPWDNLSSALSLTASLTFVIVGSANDLYRPWRSDPLHVESMRIIFCWCAAAVVTGFLAFSVKPLADFSRELAWLWFVASPAALLATRTIVRLALRAARVRGRNFRRTAIAGGTHVAAKLAQTMRDAPWMGLKFVGIYDDRDPSDKRMVAALRPYFKGSIDELIRSVEAGEIDQVYITLPLRAELRIKEMIDRLSALPVSVLYAPDFFVFSMLHARWEQVGDFNIVNVVTTPFRGARGLVKRLEDIVLSVAILAIIAIPMAGIALAIKLTSPGPAIFRQRRYGLNGKEFEILKFRTMTVVEDGGAFVQATQQDARITPLGRLLRATSLDELPQFINVLRGDMSIVGPRPHPVALDDQHRERIPGYVLRHKIRPGITGLAQVNGFRGETDTLEKMEKRVGSDIRYIDQWSLLLDLKIIFLTLIRVMSDRNAY